MLWIGTTNNGLRLLADGPFSTLTENDGLSSRRLTVIEEDAVGGLWIGTRDAGLNHLRTGGAIEPHRPRRRARRRHRMVAGGRRRPALRGHRKRALPARCGRPGRPGGAARVQQPAGGVQPAAHPRRALHRLEHAVSCARASKARRGSSRSTTACPRTACATSCSTAAAGCGSPPWAGWPRSKATRSTPSPNAKACPAATWWRSTKGRPRGSGRRGALHGDRLRGPRGPPRQRPPRRAGRPARGACARTTSPRSPATTAGNLWLGTSRGILRVSAASLEARLRDSRRRWSTSRSSTGSTGWATAGSGRPGTARSRRKSGQLYFATLNGLTIYDPAAAAARRRRRAPR